MSSSGPVEGRLSRRQLLIRGVAFSGTALAFGPLSACGGSGDRCTQDVLRGLKAGASSRG